MPRFSYKCMRGRRAVVWYFRRRGAPGPARPGELTCSINSLPYFSIRELSKRSDTLIPSARTRRAPKLVFYIQSIQSLMLFVRDITGMLPMFTDAPNHIGFANFCLRTLFHFTVSSGRENVILDIVLFAVLWITLSYSGARILLKCRVRSRWRAVRYRNKRKLQINLSNSAIVAAKAWSAPRAFINWRAGTCGLIHRCFRFISGRRARRRILLLRLRRTPPLHNARIIRLRRRSPAACPPFAALLPRRLSLSRCVTYAAFHGNRQSEGENN